MPIRFRCSYCNRLLGIATRKAGMETICPHCGYTITVPVPQEDNGRPDDDARTERLDLEDIEELLGNAVTEVAAPPAVVAAPVAEKPPAPLLAPEQLRRLEGYAAGRNPMLRERIAEAREKLSSEPDTGCQPAVAVKFQFSA